MSKESEDLYKGYYLNEQIFPGFTKPLLDYTAAHLKTECKSRLLKQSGRKIELAKRIADDVIGKDGPTKAPVRESSLNIVPERAVENETNSMAADASVMPSTTDTISERVNDKINTDPSTAVTSLSSENERQRENLNEEKEKKATGDSENEEKPENINREREENSNEKAMEIEDDRNEAKDKIAMETKPTGDEQGNNNTDTGRDSIAGEEDSHNNNHRTVIRAEKGSSSSRRRVVLDEMNKEEEEEMDAQRSVVTEQNVEPSQNNNNNTSMTKVTRTYEREVQRRTMEEPYDNLRVVTEAGLSTSAIDVEMADKTKIPVTVSVVPSTSGVARKRRVFTSRNDEENMSRGGSEALLIEGFKRPLNTLKLTNQLNEFGPVKRFWINHIKTFCYVVFEGKNEAAKCRSTMDGMFYPTDQPKIHAGELRVKYITGEEANRKIDQEEKKKEMYKYQ